MVKLLFIDVDGTLTDGGYFMDNNGNVSKKFCTHDFFGLRQLHKSNVSICALTGCVEDVTKHQFKRAAPFVHLITGVNDKVFPAMNIMGRLSQEKNVSIQWSDVAFMGDDLNDLSLLKMVGFPSCPKNAQNDILDYVSNHKDGYISSKFGGKGCVRDLIDSILKTNKIDI